MKKINWLAILALGFVFIGSAHSASAAFSGSGSGTEMSPYMITTCLQLQEMSDSLNSYYKLANNINCGSGAPSGNDTRTWNGNTAEWEGGTIGGTLIPDDYSDVTNNGYSGFVPVGNLSTPFTGTLDGDNKIISNLWIFRKNTNEIGLFGYASNATLKNIVITDAAVVGSTNVGNLVGYAAGSTITDVTINTSMVRAYKASNGGPIAGAAGNTNILRATVNGGTAHGSGNVIGGIVGYMEDTSLTDSSSSAAVDGGYELGGAVGTADYSSIYNVDFTGSIHAKSEPAWDKYTYSIGGLLGYGYNTSIENSSASSSITVTNLYNYGANDVGGLVGYYESDDTETGVAGNTASGTITIDSPSGEVGSIGGLIGYMYAYNGAYTYILSNDTSVSIDISGKEYSTVYNIGGSIGYSEMYGAESVVTDNSATGSIIVEYSGLMPTEWDSWVGDIGGFVGEIDDSGSQWYENTATGNVTVTLKDQPVDSIGGFIGSLNTDISIVESSATGNVSVTQTAIQNYWTRIESIGGFIGYLDSYGAVFDATATGNVTVHGTSPISGIGGFAGETYYENFLDGTSAKGNVTVTTDIGNEKTYDITDIGGHTGILCSDDYECTISNSYSTGNVKVQEGTVDSSATGYVYNIGGFLGNAYYDGVYVHRSFTGSDVTISFPTLHGEVYSVGGFIGYSDDWNNNFTDNYAKSNVVVDSPNMDLYDIGGFAGDVDAGQNVFINNYSVGTLSVSTNGIGGSIGGFMGYGSSDLFMTNNFRTGVMLVDVGVNEGDTIFGFAGNLDSSSVEVNNYLYHRSPTETAYATCGAAVNDEGGCTVATSETQFKNIENQPYIGATYDGDTYTWDIINDAPGEAIWFINSTLNDGFPCLYWEGMDCGTEDATPLPEVAPATVYGCMDPRAVNYNALATATNNACTYPVSAGGGRAWTPVSLPGTKPTDTPTTTLPGLIKALKLGNKTDQVKLLQQLLNKKGFTVAITGAGSSGSESILFGPKTKAAVIKFQKTNGLKPDGVVGPKTWAVLIK